MRRHQPTEDPEIPFGPAFSEDVVRARKLQGLTQSGLADRVGSSQNMISSIERYETRSSKLVRPICRLLALPLPMPDSDNPVLHRIYLGARQLADSDDDLRVVLVVIERLLNYQRQRKG